MSSAEQILKAHIKFELDRLTGKKVDADIASTVDELWDWASGTTLNQLASAEIATDTVMRWVEEWYLPDTVTLLLGSLTKRLIHLPINQHTSLGDLVDDELREAGVELIVDMQRLREMFITQATDSPLYSMLISDVLYSGIRDYVASSSDAMSKKVPGMGLLSKGASAINKRVPGLEGALEEKLRSFIKSNTKRTIRQSRDFLLEALGPDQIRLLAEEIWANAKDVQLSVGDTLDDEEIDRLISFGLEIWQDLRQSDYIAELIREAIAGIYDSYGEEKLDTVLEHLGLDRGHLRQEATKLGPELLMAAKENGLLERWLDLRLRPFYESKACAKLLD